MNATHTFSYAPAAGRGSAAATRKQSGFTEPVLPAPVSWGTRDIGMAELKMLSSFVAGNFHEVEEQVRRGANVACGGGWMLATAAHASDLTFTWWALRQPLDITGPAGALALYMAQARGREAQVSALRLAGVDLDQLPPNPEREMERVKRGATALGYCARYTHALQHSEVLRLLVEHLPLDEELHQRQSVRLVRAVL